MTSPRASSSSRAALHEAAGGHDDRAAAGGLADEVARLAVGLAGDRAGVDDVGVGGLVPGPDPPSGAGEVRGQRLGLGGIEAAAEGVEGDSAPRTTHHDPDERRLTGRRGLALDRKVGGAGHAHAEERSRRRRRHGGQPHRDAAFGASGDKARLAVGSGDEDGHCRAHERAVGRARREPQLFGQLMEAPFLLVARDVVGPAAAGRSRPRRVGGDVGHVVAELPHRRARGFELLFRLAAEPYDDVGEQGRRGQDPADRLDDAPVALQPVAAVHADEHLVVARLKRQVDLLAEARKGGDGFQHFVAHVMRVGRSEVDPEPAARALVRLADRPQQPGKGELGAPAVEAVGVHVLPEQRDRAVARGGERLDLGEDVGRLPRYLAAPGVGDRAEGAELVAAVLDRHVGLEGRAVVRRDAPEALDRRPRRSFRRRGRTGRHRGYHAVLADDVRQLGDLLGGQEHVKELEKAVAIRRQNAPGDERDEGASGLHPVPLGDAGVDLVDGPLAHGAGDDAEQVRLALVLSADAAHRFDDRADALGVGEIHLTAYVEQEVLQK